MAPERTCIACRQTGERGDLVRIALFPGGRPVIDYRAKLPGRGAWVHPRRACVDAMLQDAKALSRALREPVETDGLEEQLRALVRRALEDGLSQAAASGLLVSGHDALVEALEAGRVSDLVLARDAAERTARQLEARAGVDVTVLRVHLDTVELGDRIGKPARAAAGVLAGSGSRHLRRQLRRLRDLGYHCGRRSRGDV